MLTDGKLIHAYRKFMLTCGNSLMRLEILFVLECKVNLKHILNLLRICTNKIQIVVCARLNFTKHPYFR